jgi:hypothetical protein
MSPQDALEYGLIDTVLASRKEAGVLIPAIPSTTASQKILIENTPISEPKEKSE